LANRAEHALDRKAVNCCGMNQHASPQIGPANVAGITLVTRREGGQILKVSIESLKRWEKRGLLTPIRCGPKLVRYQLSEIQSIASGRTG
jgi:hypothetical protein